MSTQRCARCEHEEHIPTHQFVKFDLHVHYLCKSCWEKFRGWFVKGQALNLGNGYGADAA
ncbi:MAG: hypothetical protein HYZ53_01245 [Planctomycetes bacterium]|nr:hypothetical protein [Planctomycetota bacterium]